MFVLHCVPNTHLKMERTSEEHVRWYRIGWSRLMCLCAHSVERLQYIHAHQQYIKAIHQSIALRPASVARQLKPSSDSVCEHWRQPPEFHHIEQNSMSEMRFVCWYFKYAAYDSFDSQPFLHAQQRHRHDPLNCFQNSNKFYLLFYLHCVPTYHGLHSKLTREREKKPICLLIIYDFIYIAEYDYHFGNEFSFRSNMRMDYELSWSVCILTTTTDTIYS